ncbi:MAG: metal-dependent phosphohydrolase [Rhodospirillaceae bacterium]|nr:metal-dependent phosphohydrolase [Rhodospirillaceae bacterium]
MLNTTTLIVDALSDHLVRQYHRVFGRRDPDFRIEIDATVRLALERIAQSDALYHNVEHTVMVTLVGTEILRGRDLIEPVSAEDWLHFTVALLLHDIGYVRGALRADTADSFVINQEGDRVSPPRGASDAFLTPHHVDRGKLFVQERAKAIGKIDADRIACAIELTRFPIPDDDDHQGTADEPGLVRAADLIGQLADPNYLRKQNALYYEFLETGTNNRLGIASPADIEDRYPSFFWQVVEPYSRDALAYLRLTQEGKQWIANLYSHVFAVEHKKPHDGPVIDDA